MKVVHLEDAETYEPEPDWKRASVCAEQGVSVEYFVKPPGHASPPHEHPQAQYVAVPVNEHLPLPRTQLDAEEPRTLSLRHAHNCLSAKKHSSHQRATAHFVVPVPETGHQTQLPPGTTLKGIGPGATHRTGELHATLL